MRDISYQELRGTMQENFLCGYILDDVDDRVICCNHLTQSRATTQESCDYCSVKERGVMRKITVSELNEILNEDA